MTNTTNVKIGDWIRLDSDGQFFRITNETPNTSVEITNPDGLTIPAGAGASSVADPTVVTLSAGAFLDSLTNVMSFRITSGTLAGEQILIDTRDSDTQITLQSGFPAAFVGVDWEIVEADVFLFIVKKHTSGPNRELEVISTRQLQAGGPFFFNVDPVRIELLTQQFTLVSVFQFQGPIVRLYWNRVAGTTNEIVTVDYDTFTNKATSAVTSLSFEGRDPFIMDARTTADPNRLYMVYVNNAGNNAYRVSDDLGVTWGTELLIDDETATDHNFCEANFEDPLTDKEDVQVLQQRS